jgi:hypothetical protein
LDRVPNLECIAESVLENDDRTTVTLGVNAMTNRGYVSVDERGEKAKQEGRERANRHNDLDGLNPFDDLKQWAPSSAVSTRRVIRCINTTRDPLYQHDA